LPPWDAFHSWQSPFCRRRIFSPFPPCSDFFSPLLLSLLFIIPFTVFALECPASNILFLLPPGFGFATSVYSYMFLIRASPSTMFIVHSFPSFFFLFLFHLRFFFFCSCLAVQRPLSSAASVFPYPQALFHPGYLPALFRFQRPPPPVPAFPYLFFVLATVAVFLRTPIPYYLFPRALLLVAEQVLYPSMRRGFYFRPVLAGRYVMPLLGPLRVTFCTHPPLPDFNVSSVSCPSVTA